MEASKLEKVMFSYAWDVLLPRSNEEVLNLTRIPTLGRVDELIMYPLKRHGSSKARETK